MSQLIDTFAEPHLYRLLFGYLRMSDVLRLRATCHDMMKMTTTRVKAYINSCGPIGRLVGGAAFGFTDFVKAECAAAPMIRDVLDEAFYHAQAGKHTEVMRYLAAHGARGAEPSIGIPNLLLFEVCEKANKKHLRELLQAGADDLNAALRGACYGGSPELVEELLDLGATGLNAGLTFTHWNNNPSIIELLLDAGATKCHFCGDFEEGQRHDWKFSD